MKKWLIVLFLIIGFSGCGDFNDNNQNDDRDDRINLTLKTTHELPYVFGAINQNVILDNDSIIFVGGNKAKPNGGRSDGHPAFSNKAIKIDLITGDKQILDINASSGHTFDGGTIANGRGNSAKVYKYGDSKYIVFGGFQYESSFELINFSQNIVIKKDAGYPLNNIGSSIFDNGNIGFFGVNSNFGGSKITIFSKNDENLTTINTTLTINRHSTTAHKLEDGRIMILGGSDGSGNISHDSAQRRVEIFNPNDYSIIRVTDYPEPTLGGPTYGGQITLSPVENDSICVGNYQYTISQDKWESGCTISTNSNSFDSSKYNFPNNIHSGAYIKTLSNGNIIYMKSGDYSLTFSDDLRGYPVDNPTKIYIFSESN